MKRSATGLGGGTARLTGVDVAADVDDSSRQECDYLLEEPSVASLSRRINDQRRPVAGPFEVLGDGIEQRLGSTRVEGDVVDGVDGRVMVGICD